MHFVGRDLSRHNQRRVKTRPTDYFPFEVEMELVVVGIAMDSGSKKTVADFSQVHAISYPVVMGNHEIAAKIGVLEVLPSSFLFNPNGQKVGYQAGEVTQESVETYINNKKY